MKLSSFRLVPSSRPSPLPVVTGAEWQPQALPPGQSLERSAAHFSTSCDQELKNPLRPCGPAAWQPVHPTSTSSNRCSIFFQIFFRISATISATMVHHPLVQPPHRIPDSVHPRGQMDPRQVELSLRGSSAPKDQQLFRPGRSETRHGIHISGEKICEKMCGKLGENALKLDWMR